ncbi:MAG TPA: HAD family hydrolase [Candidatus Syntrophoarchaeum butanivorans]|uniref:HAD family hydrolase n=1 Tax=Candidatus Syntropharchaeum butanivorans TaxID=1839936 RepID=A0A7C0X0I6_9EURY|nr:HAD family hydrolase [Candidatus Syntrophoarchaeum butanivorans]
MKIEGVLFDIYGTLIYVSEESIRMRSRIISRYLERYGIHLQPEDVALEAAHRWIEFSKGEFADVYEYFSAVLSGLTGQSDFDEEFMEGLIEVGALESEAELLPNVVETLESLKKLGIKLGVVSNAPCFYAMRDLRALGLLEYFDAIGVSSRWKITKPDPEIFLRAADSLGLKPQNVIVVGNDPVEDVKGAKLAGMRSVLLIPPIEGMWSTSRAVFGECDDEIECEPDCVIEDLSEILEIIQNVGSQDI